FINTDKAPAYGRALALLKREGRCPSDVEHRQIKYRNNVIECDGTVAKLAMRQPFVLFKGLTFQKLCLPGAFRPGDHHNKMLRPG
ncbi:DDE-type integrase/transposase/recombinase, partial [Salmonella enterica]|uniref:DDE-type integrase/transposase/recombinase n=1 Tax=Salmonella enterica TaxID=28901 RepID=UPI0039B74119